MNIERTDTSTAQAMQEWRRHLSRGFLRASAILGLFALAIALLDNFASQSFQDIPLYLGAYGIVVVLAFHPSAPNWLQAGAILFILYALGFAEALNYGMSGDQGIFWLGFSVTAILLMGWRWGFAALLLACLSFIAFGSATLFRLHVVSPAILVGDNEDPLSWISTASMLFLVGWTAIHSYDFMFRNLMDALTRSRDLAARLEQDIAERRQKEETLRKLSRAVEQCPSSIVITDTSGRIEYVNPRFTEMTGYPWGEAIGQNPRMLKSGRTAPAEYAELWQTLRSGRVWHGEFCNRRKDGTLVWEASSISPVIDESGQITHYVGIDEDISDRKQRERELEAVSALSAAMRVASTRAEMIPVLVGQVAQWLYAQAVRLERVDPVGGSSVVEKAWGTWDGLDGRDPSHAQEIRQALAGGTSLANTCLAEQALPGHPGVFGDRHGVAGVRLTAQQQTIGYLWIGRQGGLGEGELRLLGAIGDIAANAIYRTTLFEKTQHNVEDLAALHAIDVAITGSSDLRLTLSVLLGQAVTRLQVDAADVLVLNQPLQRLEYSAGLGFRTNALAPAQVILGEGLAGRAALERRMAHVPNLSARPGESSRARLFADEGFVAYWVVPLIAKGQVMGVLEIFCRQALNPDEQWMGFLETLAGQAAVAIDNGQLLHSLQRSNADLALAYDATIEGWSRALDLRDKETEGHTQRVSELTRELARAMGIEERQLEHIRRGALLHDIGKMGVPDSILLKPGKLTEEEWVIMRKHPTYALEMLGSIAYLRPALDIPYCHHEKWDGTGYPQHLKANQIPRAARIFAVVDVWDAMCSDRPYRLGLAKNEAREYIRTQAGRHFDPEVAGAFLKLVAAV